jgi:hypothetical protein
MRRLGGHVYKLAIFCHRWLGLAFCLLFVPWLTSGMVLMYGDYPSVSPEERLSKAARLTPSAISISPEMAFAHQQQDAPDEAWLGMLDGRPVYRFRSKGSVDHGPRR